MFRWFKKESDAKTLEKELASIASKITAYETSLASLRAAHRRYKGALTLYLVLFYTIYLAGWFFFIARRTPKDLRWLGETLPIIVGPFAIAGLRLLLSAYYNRRVAGQEAALVEQRSLQHEKIEAFKARTDFYSTKSLIDRYSGDSPKSATAQSTPSKRQQSYEKGLTGTPQSALKALGTQEQKLVPLHGFTAPASLKGTSPTPPHLSGAKITPRSPVAPPSMLAAPENDARPDPRPIPSPHHWYDRILDVVIGEDESAPSSRYQLEQKLLRKDEEIRRLEMEMVKMQQALHKRSPSSEDNDKAAEHSADQEDAAEVDAKTGSSARDEAKRETQRTRRSSRRVKSKSVYSENSDDE